MDVIRVTKVDESFVRVDCSPAQRVELSEYFSFRVPGYQFIPAYRKKFWDGKIRLMNSQTGLLPIGLYGKLCSFSKSRHYMVQTENQIFETHSVDHQHLVKMITSWNIPFELRDYQYDSLTKVLENPRRVLVSPTGSGKSLIQYCITRYFLETFEGKVLIIVPTTNLVAQMTNDFAGYGFDSDSHVHQIMSGREKQSSKRVFISTYQSIYKFPQEYFEQFGCIISDECHLSTGKSISNLVQKCSNTKWKIGLTGTLKSSKVHKLVLEGLFGGIHHVTTTKKLQDKGTLSPLDIKVCLLKYDELTRSDFRTYPTKVKGDTTGRVPSYGEEVMFLSDECHRRNLFIRNLCLTRTHGNIIVFFNKIEHGKELHRLLKEKKKDVYLVYGQTKVNDREVIRKLVQNSKNSVVVGSYGTYSTGVDIPNISHLIFTSPSKSIVRVCQSIGRGLRKSEGKERCELIDLVDDFAIGGKGNYCLRHGMERTKIYKNQGWEFSVEKVFIPDGDQEEKGRLPID